MVTLLISAYMVFGPARWLRKLMQLTPTSGSFQALIVFLGIAYLVVGWVFERYVSGRLAEGIGRLRLRLSGKPKKRKAYKVIREDLRLRALWG